MHEPTSVQLLQKGVLFLDVLIWPRHFLPYEQMRLELNSVKLRRYSSQLEAFAVEQGNYSVQLLKKQVAVPSSDLPGLTAACKVYAPRYDGKPSAEKRSDEESDYLAADGTLLRLVPKQVVKFDAVQNVPPYISWVFVQK